MSSLRKWEYAWVIRISNMLVLILMIIVYQGEAKHEFILVTSSFQLGFMVIWTLLKTHKRAILPVQWIRQLCLYIPFLIRYNNAFNFQCVMWFLEGLPRECIVIKLLFHYPLGNPFWLWWFPSPNYSVITGFIYFVMKYLDSYYGKIWLRNPWSIGGESSLGQNLNQAMIAQ